MHLNQWTCFNTITSYKTLLNLRQLRHLKKYMVIILCTEFLNEDIIKRVSQDPLFTTPIRLHLRVLLLVLDHLHLLLVLHHLHLHLHLLRLHLLRLLRLHLLRLLRRQLRWRPYAH